MKISRETITRLVISALSVLILAGSLMAQTPGSPADPLVTKSFVDHVLKFRTIALPASSEIRPQPGAMLIVRSGQLRLEAPKGKTVIDLTAGREIAGGSDLPHNHLIIVPDTGDYVLKARNLTTLLASWLQE